MELISVIIINYNNKEYLKRCIESINNQTYENLEIIFIDNCSVDNSYEYMKEQYGDNSRINIIRNEVNNGYSGAANQGIKLSKGEYVMVINPDIIMDKNFIYELHNFAIKDDSVAAVTGKLLKYDFTNDKIVNHIDSVGIGMTKSRKFYDIGQNDYDNGQYEEIQQVFGVCGAAPFYKKKCLDEICIDGEYFDEDFFAYKEDVDLSWRLNLCGYKNMYLPSAIAYHGRALGGHKGGLIGFIKNRKNQSKFLRGISLRNQILMVKKNDDKITRKGCYWKIISRKIALGIYTIVFEGFNIKYLLEAKKLSKKIEAKRDIMRKNHKIDHEFIKLIK